MTNVLLKLPEVSRRVGLSKTPIYAAVKAGTFPAPVKTGVRSVAWLEAEVDQWIAERIEARRAA